MYLSLSHPKGATFGATNRFLSRWRMVTCKSFSDYENLEPILAGNTLKDAYLSASGKHFPPSGQLPDSLFFSMPQYNTWIELMYNQNQEDILKYADNILKNNFPEGVFMVERR